MSQTVVVALDGSEASREAFHRAVEEAGYRNAEVLAVHVYEYPSLTGYESAMTVNLETLKHAAEAWMTAELAHLDSSYEADVPVDVRTDVRCGHPGGQLIEAAQDADLLVLGSRGYGGFRGLLLGSVTTYCVHHLPCAVLVVPARD